MTSTLDRILGGLLGVHVGDALGAGFEFERPSLIAERHPDGLTEIVGGGPFGWKPGDATDDTDLTKAVLDAYLDAPDDPVPAAAEKMLAWYESGPRDVGNATSAGLRRYRSTRDPANAGAGVGSAGNGSLMRCIPTGLARPELERRRTESAAISAITHDDPRCVGACVGYDDLVALLMDGVSPDTAVEAVLADLSLDGFDPTVRQAIRIAVEAPRALVDATPRTPPRLLGGAYGGGGFVLDSLTIGLMALLDSRPLPVVLSDVVCLGGDTDTNAAIAGGLLGIRDGAGAIPADWLGVLQYGPSFSEAATRLMTLRGDKGG